jgi:hypothetical protein
MDGTNLNSEFSNQALAGHLNLSSNFTWKNGWSGQFNAFYRLPMKTVQGRMRGMFYGGLSVTKAVLKNKGQLSLRLEDPFFLQWHGFIFNDVLFDQDILRRWESRILYLSFTYNFGKLEVKPQRRGRRGDSGGGDMDMDM